MIIKGNTLIINAGIEWYTPISKVKENPYFHSVMHPYIFINIRCTNVAVCFIIPRIKILPIMLYKAKFETGRINKF